MSDHLQFPHFLSPDNVNVGQFSTYRTLRLL